MNACVCLLLLVSLLHMCSGALSGQGGNKESEEARETATATVIATAPTSVTATATVTQDDVDAASGLYV